MNKRDRQPIRSNSNRSARRTSQREQGASGVKGVAAESEHHRWSSHSFAYHIPFERLRNNHPVAPGGRIWQMVLVPFYMLNDNGLMLATELIRRTRPIIFRSMSSRDLPCVSGT